MVPNNYYLQPDPYSCVPTSFTYLLHKVKGINFKKLQAQLLEVSYKNYDLKNSGMELDEMKIIADKLGYPCQFSNQKPSSNSFITGVKQLPLCSFKFNNFIKNAIKENSLQISKTHFIYPYGHAIVIFKTSPDNLTIFDSLLGFEREINNNLLEGCLEDKPTYLWLENN